MSPTAAANCPHPAWPELRPIGPLPQTYHCILQDLHPNSLLPATSGFEQLPEENGIYAFHWYVPPADAHLGQYLDERLMDARRLKAAPYARYVP